MFFCYLQISISAEELKPDTKIDLGEFQSDKCDNYDKLHHQNGKLVEKHGSNSVNVESDVSGEGNTQQTN